ncbi:MAG: hypothetical protein ACYDAY_10645 [Candidatus Dormibacteria bacterium]
MKRTTLVTIAISVAALAGTIFQPALAAGLAGWSTISLAALATAPTGRLGQAMAYDPDQKVSLVFGGCTSDTSRNFEAKYVNDQNYTAATGSLCTEVGDNGESDVTTELNIAFSPLFGYQASWTPRNLATAPHPRFDASLIYEGGGQFALYGGGYEWEDACSIVGDQGCQAAPSGSSDCVDSTAEPVRDANGNSPRYVHLYCFSDLWIWSESTHTWTLTPQTSAPGSTRPPAGFGSGFSQDNLQDLVLVAGCSRVGLTGSPTAYFGCSNPGGYVNSAWTVTQPASPPSGTYTWALLVQDGVNTSSAPQAASMAFYDSSASVLTALDASQSGMYQLVLPTPPNTQPYPHWTWQGNYPYGAPPGSPSPQLFQYVSNSGHGTRLIYDAVNDTVITSSSGGWWVTCGPNSIGNTSCQGSAGTRMYPSGEYDSNEQWTLMFGGADSHGVGQSDVLYYCECFL